MTDEKQGARSVEVISRFAPPKKKKQFGCTIMTNINFDILIPNHPKLSGIKSLLIDFKMLIDSLNQKLSEYQICNFEKNAKKWVEQYGSELFLSKDITPYAQFI